MNLRYIILAGIAALLLYACSGPVVSYRYKLTLDVEVDGKIVQAFNVVEKRASISGGLQPGSALGATRGEAIVVEISPGRVLVALLTAGAIPRPEEKIVALRARPGRWSGGPDLGAIYGIERPKDEEFLDHVRRIAQLRGPRPVLFENLPDLVSFRDINDPKSVTAVDPHNLAASFRSGVSLKRATLEVVDPKTPLTKGIEKKLPWLVQLKGNYLYNLGTTRSSTSGGSLAAVIHGGFFKSDN